MYALDALRGIAAVGVAVLCHYQSFHPEPLPFQKYFYWFYQYGALCVDFFFILSGFVFSYIYEREIAENRISFYRFSVYRVSRLWPLLVITTIISGGMLWTRKMFALPALNTDLYCDVWHLLQDLLFLQSGWFEEGPSFNGPAWSISCEVVAYVLFFIILKFYSSHKIKLFLTTIFLGLFIQKIHCEMPLFNSHMARVFIGFFVGCLTHMFWRTSSKAFSAKKLLLIVVTIMIIGIIKGHSVYGRTWWNIANVYVLLLFPSLIIFALQCNLISQIFSCKLFTFLGDISYSIYLWHFPVQLILFTGRDFGWWVIQAEKKWFFFLYAACVVLVGAVSQRYELKIQNFIRLNYSIITRGD